MTTDDVVKKYFAALSKKKGWEEFVSCEIEFNSPGAKTKGKEAYVKGLNQFLAVVNGIKVEKLIVEEKNACVVSSYDLRSPTGKLGHSEVAEILTVEDGLIQSSTIFFDTAALGAFMAEG